MAPVDDGEMVWSIAEIRERGKRDTRCTYVVDWIAKLPGGAQGPLRRLRARPLAPNRHTLRGAAIP